MAFILPSAGVRILIYWWTLNKSLFKFSSVFCLEMLSPCLTNWTSSFISSFSKHTKFMTSRHRVTPSSPFAQPHIPLWHLPISLLRAVTGAVTPASPKLISRLGRVTPGCGSSVLTQEKAVREMLSQFTFLWCLQLKHFLLHRSTGEAIWGPFLCPSEAYHWSSTSLTTNDLPPQYFRHCTHGTFCIFF